MTIDVSSRPARITSALTITGGSGDYDPEGIAIAPDGTYWIASEGNASDSRPNRLLQVDAAGYVVDEVGLPDEIIACRSASENRGTLGSGFEGLTVLPQKNGYKLLVAQQRGWDYTTTDACEDLDDDAGGLNAKDEPKQTFKPEGVAITDSGRTFVVTDNDGVDDWSGETWFLRLGDVDRLFE